MVMFMAGPLIKKGFKFSCENGLFRNVTKELDFIVIKGDTGKLKIRFYVQLHFQIFFKRGFIRNCMMYGTCWY